MSGQTLALLLTLSLLGGLGCASGSGGGSAASQEASTDPGASQAAEGPDVVEAPEAYKPPEVMTPSPAPVTDEPAPGARVYEVPARGSRGTPDSASLTVVIDPATSSGAPSLIEASRAARERSKSEPIAVITNENLSEYASRGRLTIVTPGAPPEAAEESPGEEAEQKQAKDEAYWREGSRELRLLWKRSHEAVQELEEKAESLRLSFYTEENTFVRDTQIKPSWDRVLDRLEEAKTGSVRYREDLQDFLQEGRRAGALPGWLREGIELEPPAVDPLPRGFDTHEAGEPVIVDEGSPNG